MNDLQKEISELKQFIIDLKADRAATKEGERDGASRRGGKMALAISYFTVAIATASICTVTKKKPLWFVAIIMSAVAIVQMVLAWIL
jgi:uncharacterized membrane protein YoaK (UPF0700 family)